MHIEQLRDFVLAKLDVEECTPFGPDNLVYKTGGKMFLLISLDENPLRFNAKCDPLIALEYRENYPEAVLPGYHMNKVHWNTIVVNGLLSDEQIYIFVTGSYDLVAKKKKAK
jgi:predicted DNA-binding protein (MmcQ/YjbR family)